MENRATVIYLLNGLKRIVMTDLELFECAQSVYDFLVDDIDINLNITFNSFMNIPSFSKMNEILKKYDFGSEEYISDSDIIVFTLVLNSKFKIYDQNNLRNLLKENSKNFFSTTKSHDFYRTIIRDLKLKICLS